MKNARTRNKGNGTETRAQADHFIEVLYQRLGDRWYAFSLIDDEVFVGSIDKEELDGKAEEKPETVASKKSGKLIFNT